MQELLNAYGWPLALVGGVLGIILIVWGIYDYLCRQQRAQALQWKKERAAEDAARQKSKETPKLSYDEMVRAWNKLQEKRLADIQRANQEAQAMAVEEATPVLVTIRDYYACPDDEPIYKIEPFPLDDPRRRELNNSDGEIVVDDQRCLPHEQFGYGFMPRHLREQWVETCKRRQAAIKAGAIKKTSFDARPASESPTVIKLTTSRVLPTPGVRIESRDDKLQSDIDSMTNYQTSLNSRADQAFTEELEKIKADAEHKARTVFMHKPDRRASIEKEAAERNVDVKTVEDEFVALVVKAAADNAKSAYARPNRDVLAALTPEKILSGNMFTH